MAPSKEFYQSYINIIHQRGADDEYLQIAFEPWFVAQIPQNTPWFAVQMMFPGLSSPIYGFLYAEATTLGRGRLEIPYQAGKNEISTCEDTILKYTKEIAKTNLATVDPMKHRDFIHSLGLFDTQMFNRSMVVLGHNHGVGSLSEVQIVRRMTMPEQLEPIRHHVSLLTIDKTPIEKINQAHVLSALGLVRIFEEDIEGLRITPHFPGMFTDKPVLIHDSFKAESLFGLSIDCAIEAKPLNEGING